MQRDEIERLKKVNRDLMEQRSQQQESAVGEEGRIRELEYSLQRARNDVNIFKS